MVSGNTREFCSGNTINLYLWNCTHANRRTTWHSSKRTRRQSSRCRRVRGRKSAEATKFGFNWFIWYKSIYQSPGGSDAGKCGVFQQGSLAAKAARLHVTCYVFMHFYSGFRRQGDLQHNIEMQAQAFGVHLFCISIDLCLAKRHSDLTCDKTKGFWMDRMKKGQIVGIRGGPRSAACAIIWSSARAARAERDCPCSTLNFLKWGTNRHPRYIPVLMKLMFIYNGYCWCSTISRY